MNDIFALQRDVAELKKQLRDLQEMLPRQIEYMYHNIKLQMTEQANEIQRITSSPSLDSTPKHQPTSQRQLMGEEVSTSQVELQRTLSALQADVLELQERSVSPSMPILHTDQSEAARTLKRPEAKDDLEDQYRNMDPNMEGSYAYLGLDPVENEPSKEQLQWAEKWLDEVNDGELDIYSCLGLSNCFTWTPDTRRIFTKALAVTLMQLAVPFYLLVNEDITAFEWGPAKGDIGFRVAGCCLYGYAIHNMYNGADGHCRTALLNLMFQYDTVHAGYWLPLLIGEISNVFTAIALIIALFAIFTSQVAPADLIMNAIAVNFLCDCDGSLVDKDMKADALEDFKKFTNRLFTSQRSTVRSPFTKTGISRVNLYSLYLISLGGLAGCSLFLLFPSHSGGLRDTAPGYKSKVVNFNAPAGK